MKKYFYLQLKLAGKLLPFVLAVTLALLLGLGLILTGLLSAFQSSGTPFTVALSGDTDNDYMQWGLAAIQPTEDSLFSINIVEMPRDAAHSALEKGEISAYVIIPEGFMEKAMVGEIDPITYVTSTGLEGVAGQMKREITQIVTKMVVYSQKGAYGLANALSQNTDISDIYTPMSVLSLEYTDLILHRAEFYRVEELGVDHGLTTQDYYICAGLVILLALAGLPFGAIYIKKDHALSRLLRSRGYPAGLQLLCEYGAHLLAMLALAGAVLAAAGLAITLLPGSPLGSLPQFGLLAAKLLPVTAMLAALNILVFNLSDSTVSGLLLHFFGAIGLCYVSGCIYPISAFPIGVQRFAAFLPTAIARQHLATGFTGDWAWGSFGGLTLYTLGFFGIALVLRTRKTAGIER
ncbi:MAG: ABC transporter permease [Oscillospiraceae bacterium]|nr:ABC transporter permease [Oscillospiraceae bacterium]